MFFFFFLKKWYLHDFVHSHGFFLGGSTAPLPSTLHFHLCSFLSILWASFIALPQVNGSSSCPRLFSFLVIWSLTLHAAAHCHPFILNLPKQWEQRKTNRRRSAWGIWQLHRLVTVTIRGTSASHINCHRLFHRWFLVFYWVLWLFRRFNRCSYFFVWGSKMHCRIITRTYSGGQ